MKNDDWRNLMDRMLLTNPWVWIVLACLGMGGAVFLVVWAMQELGLAWWL